MPEVQNVGAADYAQYQPSQYADDNTYADYNTQPEIYDESYAQMQAANKSRLGATLLSAAVVGGLAYLGGHYMGKRGAKEEIKKATEAIEKYKEMEKKAAEMEKKAAELEKDAENVINKRFGGFKFGKDFAKKIKEFFNKSFKKAEDKKDTVKETTEKTAEDAKKAAEDNTKK